MGSAISRSAQRAAQKPASLPKPSTSTSPNARYGKKETVTIPLKAPSTTGSADGQLGRGDRASTNAEWGALLNRVSGVIETTSWDEASTDDISSIDPKDKKRTTTSDSTGSKEESSHAAQRSMRVSAKLPAFRRWQIPPSEREMTIDESGRTLRPMGKLTNEDVLDLFRRRRENAELWTAERLAKEFQMHEEDVRNLLQYTRTYMGRTDLDGILRGYYNPDRQNTIERFERD